jgi:hypothetical protein
LGLNIAVLCTFGVILQMPYYKYQAALPHSNTQMFSTKCDGSKLQISGGSAAFKYPDVFYKYLTVPMIKGFLYK